MAKDFIDQAHAAVCKLFGEAVYQLVAEGRPITNASLAETIITLSTGEQDLAADFALQLLLR